MSTFAVCFNRICEMDFLPKDPAILVSSVRSSSARLPEQERGDFLRVWYRQMEGEKVHVARLRGCFAGIGSSWR